MPSPILSLISQANCNMLSYSSLLKHFPNCSSSLLAPPLVSCKPREVFYDENLKKLGYRDNILSQKLIHYKDIDLVVCSTSLLAIDFILSGIPTIISNLHPLYSYLGMNYLSFSKADALEFLMNYIRSTTVSISLLPQFIADFREDYSV
ncbi:hypothetical protein OAA55_00440 [bacterium]|nr:hypothetical protein [bacterium]